MGPKAKVGNVNAHYNLSFFLKGVMKMADVDVDPVGRHDKTDAQPDTDETIPFTLGEVIAGKSTWESKGEQETSFGGTSLQTPDAFNFNDFKIREGSLSTETRARH